MNVLEKYATTCGVKVSELNFDTGYFPLPCDKYIVIDNRNKSSSNVYDLYPDVMIYMYKILKENDIKVIYFSKDEHDKIEGYDIYYYIGLTKKQEAFFLKNSLLNICSDNLSNHISTSLNVQNIGLYSIFPPEVTQPLIGGCHFAIESHRDGNLPSYGLEESPKTINFISPEIISQKILDLLSINRHIKYDCFYIGDFYATKVVEVIPDFVAHSSFMQGRALNLRLDYHFDEEKLCSWLSGRRLNVVTDKKINTSILKHFKDNIAQITIKINDSFDEKYLEAIRELGINLEIYCDEIEKINDYRFKFFDFIIHKDESKSKNDVPDKLRPDSKFVTSKVLLSEGKKYSCLTSKKMGKELTLEPEQVYDTPDFWKELDHYRLINEIQS